SPHGRWRCARRLHGNDAVHAWRWRIAGGIRRALHRTQVVRGGVLIWLGIKLWRAGGTLDAEPRTDRTSAAKMLCHAWLVTALNPKSITFFVAFLPQFLDPERSLLTQMFVFEATFLALAFANALGYAIVASRARLLACNPTAITWFNRAGGTLLIGAGL